jgi:hypothetical protein
MACISGATRYSTLFRVGVFVIDISFWEARCQVLFEFFDSKKMLVTRKLGLGRSWGSSWCLVLGMRFESLPYDHRDYYLSYLHTMLDARLNSQDICNASSLLFYQHEFTKALSGIAADADYQFDGRGHEASS